MKSRILKRILNNGLPVLFGWFVVDMLARGASIGLRNLPYAAGGILLACVIFELVRGTPRRAP